MNQSPAAKLISSRRHFLTCGAAALVTAMACPTKVFASPLRFFRGERSLDELGLATFAGQLHTTFSVTDAPTGRLELKLVEASRAAAAPRQLANAPDAQYEKFCLIFRGPKAPLLAQQIHRFEHSEIGEFAMFIVPIVTREADQQHYQAVFNRPVSGSTSLIT